jgi:hypothetical protein
MIGAQARVRTAELDADLWRQVKQCEVAIAALSRPGTAEPDAGSMTEELRSTGLLAACIPVSDGGAGLAHHPTDPQDLLRALVAVGRANLSAGRLFEGHVNAAKLIDLYAADRDRGRLFEAVHDGALLGIWGEMAARRCGSSDPTRAWYGCPARSRSHPVPAWSG